MENFKFHEQTKIDIISVQNYINRISNNLNLEKDIKINEILKVYNYYLYIKFNNLDDNLLQTCQKIIGRGMNIKKDNEFFNYQNISQFYLLDFWSIFVEFNIIRNINEEEFRKIYSEYINTLYPLLTQEKIVNKYQNFIRELILNDSTNLELILKKFELDIQLYLPKSIDNNDINSLVKKYCELKSHNIFTLEVISSNSRIGDFRIEYQNRAKALELFNNIKNTMFNENTTMKLSYNIIFDNNSKKIISIEFNDKKELTIKIDKNFLQENTDNRMILNNLIDLIGLFNKFGVFNMLPNRNNEDFLINQFQRFTKESYKIYIHDKYIMNIYKTLLMIYFDLLNSKDIELAQIFASYFNEYILEEFDIKSISMDMVPANIDIYNKIKIILPEFDSLVKQYYLLQREHVVHDEHFEALGDEISYQELKSFSENKYFYFNNDKLESISKNLFSDSCLLAYYPTSKRTSFYNKIQNGLNYYKMNKIQKEFCIFLKDEKLINVNSNGDVNFIDEYFIVIIEQIWRNGYISAFYCESDMYKKLLNEVEKGNLKTTNSLFTEDEKAYISYILDDKKFDNSLGIRNKYIHGKFSRKSKSEKVEIHKNNYIEILIIVFLFIVKVNEELEYTYLNKIKLK